MDIEKYKKAKRIEAELSPIIDIVNILSLNKEMPEAFYKPYFSYHKRPVLTFSLDVRIDKSLNDDLIAVIKRHKEKLEKEFEEL